MDECNQARQATCGSLGEDHIRDIRELLLDGCLDPASNGLWAIVLNQAVLAVHGEHLHASTIVRDRGPQDVQVPVHRLRSRLCRRLVPVEHLADLHDGITELLVEHALDAHLHSRRRARAAAARPFKPEGDDAIFDGHDGDVTAVGDEVGAHVVENAVDVIRRQLVGRRLVEAASRRRWRG